MSELTQVIRGEIAVSGVISFARFMELALYYPRHGYYERHFQQIGCQGDFYTNVSVGSLFGELLAFQFVRWLQQLRAGEAARSRDGGAASPGADQFKEPNPSARFQLVEAGAHDGQLALDILSWIERYEPAWLDRLEYWIIEPSSQRQSRQQDKLAGFRPFVHWFPAWDALPCRSVSGVIFSNELLDAFPVQRIGWDANSHSWFEWGVGWLAGQFVWKRIQGNTLVQRASENTISMPQLPKELLAVLPDGFTTEISQLAGHWWRQAARALHRGKLVAIDYGLTSEQFFAPERMRGTLRAYRSHHHSSDLLTNPGEQDLTAHVNFTAVQQAGEEAGLVTQNFSTQAEFLTQIVKQAGPSSIGGPSWLLSSIRQFNTLTHPEHLGRPFKVLVQSRL